MAGLRRTVSILAECPDCGSASARIECGACAGSLDGDTCPVHEDPTVIRLAGGDVIDIYFGSPDAIEVRQYHADYLDVETADDPHDDFGRYGIVRAASGTTRVTAGSSPGRAAEHRGVRAWATLEDNPEQPDYLVVQCFLEPPPPGLDQLVYTHQAVRVPPEHRV